MLCLNECFQIYNAEWWVDYLGFAIFSPKLKLWSTSGSAESLESMILLSVLCMNTLNQNKAWRRPEKKSPIMLTYGNLMQNKNKSWDMESLAQKIGVTGITNPALKSTQTGKRWAPESWKISEHFGMSFWMFLEPFSNKKKEFQHLCHVISPPVRPWVNELQAWMIPNLGICLIFSMKETESLMFPQHSPMFSPFYTSFLSPFLEAKNFPCTQEFFPIPFSPKAHRK